MPSKEWHHDSTIRTKPITRNYKLRDTFGCDEDDEYKYCFSVKNILENNDINVP